MRPGLVNTFWTFESELRGAARRDGHMALELSNRAIPRAKVPGAPPDGRVQFGVLCCEFGVFVLGLSFGFSLAL